jgi:lactate dehydrogenase-like 2-hydroxyacid dehydrogenase
MQKILITREVFPEVVAVLGKHFEIDYQAVDEAMAPEALAARLADKSGVISMITDRIDAALLQKCPQLRAVCNAAVGTNNIDIEACTKAGVMVTNTPGVLDDTTADMAWVLLLASARRVVQADQWVRQGQWQGWKFKQWLGSDAHHATLGVLGMGRIGQAVARRAAGFDMRVIYHKRTPLASELEAECRASWVDKETLLRESDYLVLLLPYSAQSHHVIGAAELALMKPTAHLINIARGGIVDDAALIEALQQRRIAGAGMDVFEGEPALDPRFFALDNVVLAPHIGSASSATRMKMAMLAAENLIAALAGKVPPNLLNPLVGKTPR